MAYWNDVKPNFVRKQKLGVSVQVNDDSHPNPRWSIPAPKINKNSPTVLADLYEAWKTRPILPSYEDSLKQHGWQLVEGYDESNPNVVQRSWKDFSVHPDWETGGRPGLEGINDPMGHYANVYPNAHDEIVKHEQQLIDRWNASPSAAYGGASAEARSNEEFIKKYLPDNFVIPSIYRAGFTGSENFNEGLIASNLAGRLVSTYDDKTWMEKWDPGGEWLEANTPQNPFNHPVWKKSPNFEKNDVYRGAMQGWRSEIAKDAARGDKTFLDKMGPSIVMGMFTGGLGSALGGAMGGGALGKLGGSAIAGGLGSLVTGGNPLMGALTGGLGGVFKGLGGMSGILEKVGSGGLSGLFDSVTNGIGGGLSDLFKNITGSVGTDTSWGVNPRMDEFWNDVMDWDADKWAAFDAADPFNMGSTDGAAAIPGWEHLTSGVQLGSPEWQQMFPDPTPDQEVKMWAQNLGQGTLNSDGSLNWDKINHYVYSPENIVNGVNQGGLGLGVNSADSGAAPVFGLDWKKLAEKYGMPLAQKLLMSSLGGTAAGNNLGALRNLFGAGNQGGIFSNLIPGILEALGAKSSTDKLVEGLKDAAEKADPFRAERPFYQQQLKQQYSDPNYFMNNPVFKGMQDEAQRRVGSSAAARGLNLSGNALHETARTAQETGFKYALPFMDQTATNAGAKFGPGFSGSILAQAAQGAAQGENNMFAGLGYAADPFLSSIFGPSSRTQARNAGNAFLANFSGQTPNVMNGGSGGGPNLLQALFA